MMLHGVSLRCKSRGIGLSVGVGDPMLSCSLHFDPPGFLPWSPSVSVVTAEGYMHCGERVDVQAALRNRTGLGK